MAAEQQENKDFSEDVGDHQNYEQQNGDTENGGTESAENGTLESQEDR